MKIKLDSMSTRILMPVFGIIVILIGIQTWRAWQNANSEKERLIKRISSGHDRLMNEAQQIAKENLQLALALSAIDSVKEAVGLEDRERLIEIVTPIVKSIKSHSDRVLKVHFHLPPGRSFVRLWKLNKFGDDISGFRRTVVEVLQTGRPVYGIEAGRAGLAVRGVAPIFWGEDTKRPVGSVEVITALNCVAKRISKISGEKNAIYGILKVKTTASAFDTKGQIGRFSTLLPPPKGVGEGLVDLALLESGIKRPVIKEVGNLLITASPLKDYKGDGIGVYVRFVDITGIKNRIHSAVKGALFTSILGLLLAIGIIFVVVRVSLSRPLEQALGAMNEISSGKMDRCLPVEGASEMRDLMTSANSVIYSVGNNVITLKTQSETMKVISKNLKEAGDILYSGGKELDQKAAQVAESARKASSELERVAKSTEEMATATSEIAQNVVETARVTDLAQDKANIASEVINRLGESSRKIGEVTQVINAIAEQTNLLALNATIEAARAGEAGKGFAVVANEVKELAGQTAKSTEDITKMIETIQADTASAIQAVEEITEIVGQVNDLANTIASAAEQQTATVKDISESVNDGAESVKEVEDQAEDMSQQATEFLHIALMVMRVQTAVYDINDELKTLADNFTVNEEAIKRCEKIVRESVYLQGICTAHQQWRQRLLRALLAGQVPDVETDPSKCSFGQWLTRAPMHTPGIRNILSQIKDAHDQMHLGAVEIQKHIRDGKGAQGALLIFEEKIMPLSTQVIKGLKELRLVLERQGL